MFWWLLIGVVVLGIILFAVANQRTTEGFRDVNTLAAQHQQLQMEGERRYNPLARAQATTTNVPADQAEEALRQLVPTPASHPATLLTFLGMTPFGAADDGVGKSGAPQEQTGVLQQKINFCEMLNTDDCSKLDDPRYAECGVCLFGGKNSKGQPHRGGLYISPDDQIRAATSAKDSGGDPVYQPTIGECKPENFRLLRPACDARKAQIGCLLAGAATSSNSCAQCYGASTGGTDGLMFIGAKPQPYTAILNVSHPGGTGNMVVRKQDGTVYQAAVSDKQLLDPQQITMSVTEGDILTITVSGMPAAWCAWLSSPDGNRTVDLSIGEQTVEPANGIVPAGDKRSSTVSTLMSGRGRDVWPTFQNTVPNTVLWYMRRDEVVAPFVWSAWYGTTPASAASPVGTWVTTAVQQFANAGTDFVVGVDSLLGTHPFWVPNPDPAPGQPKTLYITTDTGNQIIVPDGQKVTASQIRNSVVLTVQIPATLVDPIFPNDRAACPTGPLVLTEVGAGLMGSHSCFKPDGSFNTTQSCLQELFQAAGGTPAGTAFPNTDDKVAALVVADPVTGEPSMDATVAALNQRVNIAIYGMDSNGAPVDFATFTAAAQAMLGFTPKNPCDGPAATTGPHSQECLDYLWRTSGNAADDNFQMTDITQIPYQFCSAAGIAAPLSPSGVANYDTINAANGLGSVSNIRTYFKNIYNRAQDSSDFDQQASAMRDCYGINIVPPPTPPSACPPPQAGDFQCFGPEKLQMPEVFYVSVGSGTSHLGNYNTPPEQASAVCASYGARVASFAELTQAQQAGADWCATGWVSDSSKASYPITTSLMGGCALTPGISTWTPGNGKAGTNCIGIKPPKGTDDILPFQTGGSWNQPQAVSSFGAVSDQWVPACKESNGQVVCASRDGAGPVGFASADACAAWTANPASDPSISKTMVMASENGQLAGLIDEFVRARA